MPEPATKDRIDIDLIVTDPADEEAREGRVRLEGALPQLHEPGAEAEVVLRRSGSGFARQRLGLADLRGD